MALDGFYNLKEKKKKSVLMAIRTCLARKSYDELSVNDIAMEAEIARGSFYNYFADKNDAVRTLVDSTLKKHLQQYKDSIIEENCKLFEGTKRVYSNIKDILKDEISRTVMRNMKFFMEFVISIIHSKKYEKDYGEFVDWIYNNAIEIKEQKLSKSETGNTIDLIIMLIMNSIFTEIVYKPEDNATYNKFESKLDIIKNGVCK